MKRSASLRGFVLALVLLGTAETPLEAQTPTLQDVQVEDLRGLKDKFISLGEAFSAEIYDWTRPSAPAPRTSSVRPCPFRARSITGWATCTSIWVS